MFYVIYLLTSSPLRAPSVLGRIISSCPLKTIETLSLGFFTRPSAPLRTARSCVCLPAKRLFRRLTTYSHLFCLVNIFLWFCKPLCFCVKGGLNKRRLDLTWSSSSSSSSSSLSIHVCVLFVYRRPVRSASSWKRYCSLSVPSVALHYNYRHNLVPRLCTSMLAFNRNYICNTQTHAHTNTHTHTHTHSHAYTHNYKQ